MIRLPFLRPLAATLLALAAASALAHGSGPHKVQVGPPEQTDWGIAATGALARTITLTMDDRMRFTPAQLVVREGERVRIVVRNQGSQRHEVVIGTPAALEEHAALMLRFPDMAHDEPWMAHVEPGARGELRWHFNRPGRFQFACLIAGHYQAGMVGDLLVQPRHGTLPAAPASAATAATVTATSGEAHAHH